MTDAAQDTGGFFLTCIRRLDRRIVSESGALFTVWTSDPLDEGFLLLSEEEMVTIKQLTKKRDALVSIVRNGVWAGWQLDMTDAGAGHRRLFLDV
eukprot:CAMPEP_0204268986 /NCGR_PEP_ID=MMETSP0468-20130131/15499_1 /ASSEMBLY_ACC=CAM_ASM_000383 /TAXON_ID=2969 /ORGANISM="Oxyrrhis marina" /LENGTH=94 /DNA_ID=CAMNT_0051244317 /DNA_START=1 /DNA_END=283 /DNA_ORIENTATION=-